MTNHAFANIAPYQDADVHVVLQRLLTDGDFISRITQLRLGARWRWCYPLARPLVARLLRHQLGTIDSVFGLQMVVKKYMDRMIEHSTRAFTVSGLAELSPDQPYLFISNHRDIVLDPAFVNYALYHNGHDTVRIAIGDNLLTKPWVSDLMRLNKSFIVQRSATGPRQMLAVYKTLSAYIRHSIEQDASPIWIAQREGRAKDGKDRTEAAIIKMLAMSRDKDKTSFADHIKQLHIVPVAISYEWDPCDSAKANELYQTMQHGKYQKAPNEDNESIAKGITGYKGNVHVSFGTPLQQTFDHAEEVAQAIDQQVITNYVLHPTNVVAYDLLHETYPEDAFCPFDNETLEQCKRDFTTRLETVPEEHRHYLLGIYAAIIEQKQLLASAATTT